MNPWLKRIIIAVVVLEFVYVVLGNLALRLPQTQTLLNSIRPDKFEVTWEEAWSWYPFRVHARGVSANGQSRRQQWQLEMPVGSASIPLLPLIFKQVYLNDIYAEDVRFLQRPRLRPDRKYAAVREYFPPIRNREITGAEPLPTGKRGWTIHLDNARVSGTHQIWFYQVRADIEGELGLDLSYRTRGGPFTLDNGQVNVSMERVVVNGDQHALQDVFIKGSVAFDEFVPRQTKALDSLAFLTASAELHGDVDSLQFLNLYLRHFEGMHLSGHGRVAGQVNFDRGVLLPGTRLDVTAPALTLDMLAHQAKGGGHVAVEVNDNTPDTLEAAVRFGELVARRHGDERPLFTGKGLQVEVRGDADLYPEDDGLPVTSYLGVTLPAVTVPDLAVYQHYIPDKLGLRFHGGEGVLHGKLAMDRQSLHADLKLDAADADVGIKDYRFRADVDVALLSETPKGGTGGLDVAGTYIRLSNARLANGDKGESAVWAARAGVDKGLLNFHLQDDIEAGGLLRGFHGKHARDLLEAVDGALSITGHVTSLGWLNQLMKNRYRAEIEGTGDLRARLKLADGWLAAGSRVEVLPNDLAVKVLDYIATGEGNVVLTLEEGGRQPDALLDVQLKNAAFKRRHEDKAMIDHVEMNLRATARDMTFKGPAKELGLWLRIPAARVEDMSVYNQYLPENSPLSLLGGEADLVADIHMQPETATGYVKLKTDGLRSRLEEQEISGDVTVDVKVVGGTPGDMAFDISGSTLLLDNVRVTGDKGNHTDADWNARVDFTRATTVWKKPVRLKADADIEMKDSTPIVAMLANHRNKNGWISKLLTVGRIEGEASLDMQKNRVIFPYAFAGSDKIDVGAKGIITKETRDGVIFARYRKLKGLLKIHDGKRNFDIIKAQKKFDAYSPASLLK